MSELSIVGQRIPKVDAKEKITGRAVYAADLDFPGMLYGKIVRCLKYAHAKVTKLDLSEAAKVPGVVKVLGPKDVTQKGYNTGVLDLMVPEPVGQLLGDIEDQVLFATHVKHQGDAIAGIIAKTEEAAERAAEKIVVEYEPLPVYLTAEESMKPDAVQFTPLKPGNRAFQLPAEMFPNNIYGWGDAEAEMKNADLIIENTFYTPKCKQCQMEPHAYVAYVDDQDRINCWTSSQMPKLVHNKIARLFQLPMTKVKIHQTIVGGGFGGRLGMIGEPETCAMAMAVPGKYVKVQYLREEDWIASESRHPGKYYMKMGFKNDGTPVACQAHFTSYKGGYYTHGSGVAFTTGSWLIGMYKFGAMGYKGDTYYTNQAPCGAFRSYGNAQTSIAMEQTVDEMCYKLGLDPVEWRMKWHKGVGDDGWCMGFKYPSCALDECLQRGAEAIGWREKRAKYANQTGVKRRGVGVAVMNHTSGAMPMLLEHTAVQVKINEDATAEVILSCSDLGTGAYTSLKMIAAETLGFGLDEVHLLTGNSDASGFDIGAHASRTCYVGGGAVKAACEDAKKQIFDRAARQLEANVDDLEMKDKKIFVKGSPDKAIDIKTITSLGVYNFVDPATGKTIGIPGQILGYASHFAPHNSPPFAACFAEVEVDIETGEVKVLEAVQAYDIGRAIHPPSCEGQNEGALQQGIGMALMEEIYYDKNGLALNSSFTDYKMPGPADMPKFTNILVEDPDPIGPYGAKSAGEGALANPPGAVLNAIHNAIGIMMTEAPATPEKILKAIKEKGIK